MAKKFDRINELYDETVKKAISPDKWTDFLETACHNYKLRFDEQLLIYAQQPLSTAVLEIKRWNKYYGRLVNRGAKGIAVFEDCNGANQRLVYYFDVSDTHKTSYSKSVLLWTMQENYTNEIIKTLDNSFGKLYNRTTLEEAIISAANKIYDDVGSFYLRDLINTSANSLLEGLPDEAISVMHKQLVVNSVAYMVLSRLQIDTSLYFSQEDFDGLGNFNTRETLNSLGFATSDIAKTELVEIAKTISSLQKAEHTQDTIERSIDNGDNLQEGGRLLSSGFRAAGTAGGGTRSIRSAEATLSEGESQSDILQLPDSRNSDAASIRGGTESSKNAGSSDGTDGSSRGRDRAAESNRPNGMGSQNEQHSEPSEGNREQGSNIRLEYYDRSNEDKSIEFLHKDEDIKAILLNTPFLKESKTQIKQFFETVDDHQEQIEYIKSIFNNDLTELTVPDGRMMGYKTYQNVLHIWEGSFDNRIKQGYYDWGVIASYFKGMQLLNELTDTVKPLPSIEGQLELLQTGVQNQTPVFSFSQEIIDTILCKGSQIGGGKFRIYRQFQTSLSSKENADFLRNEYGWGGVYPVIIGTGIDEMHDAKGITLSKDVDGEEIKHFLSWNQVEKRIGELIRMGRYFNSKEEQMYSEWLDRQEQEQPLKQQQSENSSYDYSLLSRLKSDCDYFLGSGGRNEKHLWAGSIEQQISKMRELYDSLPQKTDWISEQDILDYEKRMTDTQEDEYYYEYHIGDKVYLGANEYEITALSDDRVTLVDSKFPLFVSEMTKDEFEAKADETPLNNHLHAVKSATVDNLSTNDENIKTVDDLEQANDEISTAPTEKDFDADSLVGKEVRIDDHLFVIESVGKISGDVSLRDITLQNGMGFPINRVEKLPFVRRCLQEQSVPDETPLNNHLHAVKPATVDNLSTNDENIKVADELPKEPTEEKSDTAVPLSFERHNFDLAHNEVEEVGKKERFRRNYAAIKVLKQCEQENRLATIDEQITLSKYVGWGGIPEAFDERASAWQTEYAMLQNILTPEEYASARESTLTAFYTPQTVIEAVYKALGQLGFCEGNILEPSCGIGHFIGMLPDEMKGSKVYGVELDTISAGIAQQLYQKTSIAAQGFEETNLPDSFFDVVVGNVPFGDFKVIDKRYDKHKFLIHDYFFAKSLDKLRPGGVIAFITSKGTMDKENNSVRKYIAQRADLLGAIRLPNNTFKGNAGTEVVSDILILQKRDRLVDIEPDWVHLDTDENGIKINSYFVEHPEMVLGEMKMVSGRFGMEATCEPYENADLAEQLNIAVANIHGEITDYEVDNLSTEEVNSIPADPNIRNYSYTVVDDTVYFRENSVMSPAQVSSTAENRIKELIKIRDSVRKLIELQTEDYPDDDIVAEQNNLNKLYDEFAKKYGRINSKANISAFNRDSSLPLLSSLEVIDENKNFVGKADMFYKRTIKPHIAVTSVDTSSEALAVSMGEKAYADMEYMCQLTGKGEEEIFADLKGVIFLNPLYGYGNSTEQKYLTADEYLSGNVREKLAIARKSAEVYPEDYTVNVEALEKVQPKDLTASEISVRLGATWLPTDVVKKFMFELLDTQVYIQWNIKVHFSEYTGEWNIEGKSYDRGNVKAYTTYGTSRINAYKIIEETLNLKDVRIFDYIEDEDGKKKAVLNKKETAIAQAKQELIKQGFQDWIWADPERREKLCKMYNEKFNSIRPREYDGSHINFSGMNPEIELREHQQNAVAHILYGGNTLLAHAVGAGKTFEMVSAAMESKRLGLCTKSLFVVPNHLIEQWAAEFLQLYPAANILVATKRDFEPKNRKRFCGRISTGDYDAVIIGHSQFEKIPMSIERQRAILEEQLEEITDGIADLKRNRGDNFSVKQLERTKKSVKQKLEKLNDQTRKDDVVTFEELGVDRLFIDESHYYKNLFLYTKMRNVGGIAQTEAMKSSDLFMKCRYLDEITGGRGTVFATGTPISNSMVELYTIQRYLQYNTLVKNNLQHFDSWASTFGETVTAVELTPEGTGYRAKTRFARFYNLPELMAMFKEVADIKTADMLNLPVPKAVFHNISVKPSEIQRQMVADLANRAEKVRNGMVDASVDNMLKITNDGRKLALDQRLINPMLPDFEGSKLNACVDAMFDTWEKGKDKRSTQLFFCDLSTPKNDGNFSVYDDIRKKLIERGVPAEEIKFIHEADTEAKKLELFKKVRRGDVRVLMGSTQKMGAGTNVQNKLAASSDLDCPWRPSDLEQRLGRSIRQGNENAEVDIFRFVTEETFDAYLYQLVEGKQKFASQIMTSKSPVRSCEDIDETALSYAEIKMLATGNPLIKEKMDLDIQVQKLQLLKANYLSEKYVLEDKVIKHYPKEINRLQGKINCLEADVFLAKSNPKFDEFVGMKFGDKFVSDKERAGLLLLEATKTCFSSDGKPLGEYRGFKTEVLFDSFSKEYKLRLIGKYSHYVKLGTDVYGNITRIDNAIDGISKKLEETKNDLNNTKVQYEVAQKEVKKPFPQDEELKAKTARQAELNILLNLDKKQSPDLSDPIESMRHRDTDGDGVCDYIDSNGYTKPNDKYQYREVSEEQLARLRATDFNLDENCCQSEEKPNTYIIRFAEEQADYIDKLIAPSAKNTTAMKL